MKRLSGVKFLKVKIIVNREIVGVKDILHDDSEIILPFSDINEISSLTISL